jgi:hypothetical protein
LHQKLTLGLSSTAKQDQVAERMRAERKARRLKKHKQAMRAERFKKSQQKQRRRAGKPKCSSEGRGVKEDINESIKRLSLSLSCPGSSHPLQLTQRKSTRRSIPISQRQEQVVWCLDVTGKPYKAPVSSLDRQQTSRSTISDVEHKMKKFAWSTSAGNQEERGLLPHHQYAKNVARVRVEEQEKDMEWCTTMVSM